MTELSKNILRILIYSDVFGYPLKQQEIFRRLAFNGMSENEFGKELDQLVSSAFISKIDGYYLIENRVELVKKRIEANNKAINLLPKARKNAKLISAFPFVRAVFLSGSISKGDADKKADIDYFIITSTGRLWITRSLLTIYKKIFLLNSYRYFCLNYFIDQNDYRIEDKNIFTATELISLIPLYGTEEFRKFIDANQWVFSFYPYFNLSSTETAMSHKAGRLKILSELILNNKLGDILDSSLMKLTISTLNHKLRRLNKQGADDAFSEIRFEKHCCKYHRNSFQKRILNSYNSKLKEFEIKHSVFLS
jgi:hypothetical protein